MPRSRHETGPPHVTSVLREAGLQGEWYAPRSATVPDDYYLNLGTAVHRACELSDENDLDESTLDERIRPRLVQYRRFLSELNVEVIEIEREVSHPIFKYVGRLDRLVRIGSRLGVLDLKSPSVAAWQGPQTAAYREARVMEPLASPITARWTLHLHDTKYVLREWTDRDDWNVFLSALTVANWRRRNGLWTTS